MLDDRQSRRTAPRTLVVGGGIGGLSAALRLQSAGHDVTIIDTHPWPGGKMRTVPSAAGPVDAGPTVLTMRHVFDDLFATSGCSLDDHVTLVQEKLVARHFWQDGSSLDLTNDHAANAAAISKFSGPQSAKEYLTFSRESEELFTQFSEAMMQASDPRTSELAKVSLRNPRHLAKLSPFATLRKLLIRRFSDPRLAQLFGRYATYVGGSPIASPALLSLIWHAEVSGVWRVSGGMHRLALAVASRFQALGGDLRLGEHVKSIDVRHRCVTGLALETGERLSSDNVVFAGDPRALATGLLGDAVRDIAKQTRTSARSLSARVWSFAAIPKTSLDLAYHNVLFARSPTSEFEDLAGGAMPHDPTLYICAQDRGTTTSEITAQERFEIILNAAPLTEAAAKPDEEALCRQTTFQTLREFGLHFEPTPQTEALATPTTYETLFPGSAGALYGQTPHGMTASLRRPRARTSIRGLYLAGGGTHPGAGVPMAALSGKHAAETILKDLVST
ncbi:MAG: 1-hydroxycarotenoid 3,4-desaturase CrtD [Pseudomonadota bacterium]